MQVFAKYFIILLMLLIGFNALVSTKLLDGYYNIKSQTELVHDSITILLSLTCAILLYRYDLFTVQRTAFATNAF